MSEDRSPALDTRRIAYLFTRYPVMSQTFCDSEMLELEARGAELVIASLNPPSDTFRHERQRAFRAPVLYPPPPGVVRAWEERAKASGVWEEKLAEMVARHERDYGKEYKAAVRARNALSFAEAFRRRGIGQIHVHFANRATHTALFIKQLTGIPFSFTAHAQDFMVDLGNDDLLREMCREAAFVVAVSDWSRDLLARTCPDSADKIVRIYNGIRLDEFPRAEPGPQGEAAPLRMISIGRLIEFKGFHHLLAACARLRDRGIPFRCTLIGDGPWRDRLLAQRESRGLTEEEFDFAGTRTQEQVKALLAASDVFVLPCVVDAKGASDILPTVIMEAMAAGLPVVSTRLVGVPEMVEHERTGLLVEPGDEESLAGALMSLAGDPARRIALGEAGRALCAERFARAHTVDQLLRRLEAVEPVLPSGQWTAPRAFHVVDAWPAPEQPWLEEELDFVRIHHQDVALVACSGGAVPAGGPLLEVVEFLPDAMVLEAEWEQDRAAAKTLVGLRPLFAEAVSTERYFLEARRAVQLAVMLRKSGARHVHAARADGALACWMAFRLGAADRFTFAAEPGTFLEKRALDVLWEDAAVSSRADRDDELRLAPPERRHFRLGGTKIRVGHEPLPDRNEVLRQWTALLYPDPS